MVFSVKNLRRVCFKFFTGNTGNTGKSTHKGVYIPRRPIQKWVTKMISSAEKPSSPTEFSEETDQLLVKPHEIILQNIKENGVYRVNYSFNGRISEPKNVGKIINDYENNNKLLREGVKGEPGLSGLSFSVLVYDRETMHKIYLLLISQRARVKVERLNYNEAIFEKIQEKILRSLSN